MIFLGEPIGTWISIVAMLISISSVFIALRKQKLEEQKQKYEERIALAEKIERIKTISGEQIRKADKLIKRLNTVEKLAKSKFGNDEIYELVSTAKSNIESIRATENEYYLKLGYSKPNIIDPVQLSAIIIEKDFISKEIDDVQVVLERVFNTLEKNKTTKKVASVSSGKRRIQKKE